MSGELPRHQRRDSSPSSFDAASNPFNQCDLSLKIVLGFLSTRVLRGGPRLVVQLIVAAFSLILLANFFTSPTADTILSSGSRWTWSPFGIGGGRDGSRDVVGPGTVRLVAFGSPDIATPSSGKGWTEMLCEELRCSSHHSYIPTTINLPAAALTSHEHYRATIEKVTRELDQAKAPGYDYDFLLQQFPLAESIADLAAQVDRFLAEPQPSDPASLPRETVWVFSCGTWDVWTLSALPRDLGQGIVDLAVRALFAQVERVYQASLSTESVAFSDFWAYQNASLLEERLVTGSSGRSSSSGNAGRETSSGGGGSGEDEELPVEKFRVIIPELFDVSLTPGWHAQRPTPPAPHTKAEQMTNAAHLTTRWNSEVRSRVAEWMRTPDPQPAKTDDSNNSSNNKNSGGKGGESVSASKRTSPRFARRTTANMNDRSDDNDNDTDDEDVLHVPYPRRLAAQVHTAEFVREAIIERQMRQHGLTDFTGRGNRTDAGSGSDSGSGSGSSGQGGIYFAETWTPCIWAKTSETPDTAGEYAACDTPGDFLFHAPFTLGERAIRATARMAAAETRSRLAFVDVVEEEKQQEEDGEGGQQQQQQQQQQQHQDGDKKTEKQTAKRATRRERSADPSSLRRNLRLSLRARAIDAACPSLDVC